MKIAPATLVQGTLPEIQSMQETLKYLCLTSGLVLLILSGVGCLRNKKVAALASVPALLLMVFGSIDRIETFKASFATVSFEEKTRELASTVDEAQKVLEQLRMFAVNTAKSLIQLSENSHAIVADSVDVFAEQDAYKAQILQALKDMDISPEKIKEVAQSDSNIVEELYAYAAWRFGRDELPQNSIAQYDSSYNKLATAQHISPEQIQKLFDDFHIDVTKFADHMEDFRYYVKTKEQRRPDIWTQRAKWAYGKQSQR